MSERQENRGRCEECAHFRTRKWVSTRLMSLQGFQRREAVSAIKEFATTEKERFDDECRHKINPHNGREDTWDFQPQVSPYCGVDENSEVHYIYEVKNAGQRCRQFQKKTISERRCETCSFRVAAAGFLADHKKILELMNYKTIGNTQADHQLSQYESSIGERQSREITELMHNRELLSEPNYLDYCSKLSIPEEKYVICIQHNFTHTCDQWSQRGR